MYAIISTGGKQYKVQEGEILKVEKLGAEVGDAVDFTDVLLVGDGDNANIGEPMLQGAKVTGEVVEHGRADKINICLLYTSPSPRDGLLSRMPSSA